MVITTYFIFPKDINRRNITKYPIAIVKDWLKDK